MSVAAAGKGTTTGIRPLRRAPLSGRMTLLLQALFIGAVLLGWEFVPKISELSQISPIFDVFFISAPTRVYNTIVNMAVGTAISGSVWPYVRETVQNSLQGAAIGFAGGMTLGLLLSNDQRLNQILRPFIVSFNAVPRIAMIPIIVILLGATGATAVASASITAFFTVFFNAYAGGRAVPAHVLDNVHTMSATPFQVMRRVRLPYVIAWSLASLPNAVSHGLLSTVTAEILTGYAGMGRLLIFAVGSASASLTIAVVIYLSTLGVVMVTVSDVFKRRWLHWWIDGRAG